MWPFQSISSCKSLKININFIRTESKSAKSGEDYIKKLNLILPPGWFEALDPVTGKIYYCHTPTETTQWLHPGIPVGTIMPNGIPYGWDTAFDKETGARYWINHTQEYNTWVKPDCIKKQQH